MQKKLVLCFPCLTIPCAAQTNLLPVMDLLFGQRINSYFIIKIWKIWIGKFIYEKQIPERMKRKLIRQSGSSLTVYLPKKWVDAQGLKAGDEVDVSETDNAVIISSNPTVTRSEISCELISMEERFIRLTLSNIYRLGYDKLTLKLIDERQKKMVRNVIDRYMMGFEVLDEKKDLMVLESVTEPSEEKQDALLRKMFLLMKQSFEMLTLDLKKGSLDHIEDIREASTKVNLFANFCIRNISKKRFTEQRVSLYWSLYLKMTHFERSIFYCYDILNRQLGPRRSLRLTKKTLALFDAIQQAYNDLYEGFFQGDIARLKRSSDISRATLNDVMNNELIRSKGIDTIVIYYAGEMSRLVYLTSSSALGLVLK